MAFHRGIDGAEPIRPQPITRLDDAQEERRSTRTGHLASGSLACPRCDAPVATGGRTLTPTEALGCPYCGHAAALRDFLSLAAPSRPARVEVRVVEGEPLRPRRAVRRAY